MLDRIAFSLFARWIALLSKPAHHILPAIVVYLHVLTFAEVLMQGPSLV